MQTITGVNNIFLKIGWLIHFFLISCCVSAQLHPVSSASSLNFTIHNFGFKVSGTLAAPEGDILFNPDSLSASYFHITVKSASINTNNDSRDEHLREAGYFDVKNYPLIRFISENIRTVKKGQYEVKGKLTIKNKTQEIILPFTAEKAARGYIFSGNFKMKRKDYDVGSSSTISDELMVDLKVSAQ